MGRSQFPSLVLMSLAFVPGYYLRALVPWVGGLAGGPLETAAAVGPPAVGPRGLAETG